MKMAIAAMLAVEGMSAPASARQFEKTEDARLHTESRPYCRGGTGQTLSVCKFSLVLRRWSGCILALVSVCKWLGYIGS